MGKFSKYAELDPEFKVIQPAAEEAGKQLFSLPLDQLRAALRQPEAAALAEDAPKNLSIEDSKIPVRDGTEIGIRIYKSKSAPKRAPLFFVVHGGGWVVGGHEIEEAMNRYVAARTPCIVISVDYRMAPEFRYPYAANDSFDALVWCRNNAQTLDIDKNRILVGGSSAGGNLSAVVAQMARDHGISGIIGQVLNIPVTCHPKFFPKDKYEYDSFRQNENAPMLPANLMMWFWDHYTPPSEVKPEPYHSPLLGDLKGLPPALVQVAGLDPLRDEGIAYAEALLHAAVPVKMEVFPGVPHGFGAMPPLSVFRRFHDNVIEFVNKTVQVSYEDNVHARL